MADDVTSNASTSRPGSPVASLPGGFATTRQPAFRFNWDPAQRRKPGPGSVYSEAESRGDFASATPTPRADLFNLSSATLATGALPNEWSSAKHGFHGVLCCVYPLSSADMLQTAISTVLNHPTKRAAPPKAHSALPFVQPAVLPRVRRKDFEGYLQDVAPEWERFERNRLSVVENHSPFLSSGSSSTLATTIPQRPIPSLSTVPPVFFDPAFNLGNPSTFALVTEQPATQGGSRLPGTDIDPASISHSLPLLDKLSHYADTIEQHLVREVQARSSSFFEALTNLHDLQSESESCLKRIGELKGMLEDVDEKQAKRGLAIVKAEAEVDQMDDLQDGIKIVKDVQNMKGIAQGLVAAGEWSDALRVVENIQTLWDRSVASSESKEALSNTSTLLQRQLDPRLPPVAESPTRTPSPSSISTTMPEAPFSLSSLRAFAALPQDLRALSFQIASSQNSELIAVLRLDLDYRITSNEIRNPDDDLAVRDQLRSLLHGLLRTNGMKDAVVKWRESVIAEVRACVKQVHQNFLVYRSLQLLIAWIVVSSRIGKYQRNG